MKALVGVVALLASFGGCGGGSSGDEATGQCAPAASAALRACVDDISAAFANCFVSDGALCADTRPDVVAVLADAGSAVRAGCSSDARVRQAGFGPQMTVDGLATRIEESCRAEATSVAVRSFGGPHGAALASANPSGQACLFAAHASAVEVLVSSAAEHAACLEDAASCDPDAVALTIAGLADAARGDIGAACGPLQSLVGIDTATYTARTVAQADCMTAAAHPESAPLDLRCGSEAGAEPLPRGTYAQVVLDEARWGSRCGDGSPYAFQVRLAPEGFPVENVIVAMQGGGVCIFEQDCRNIPAGLFEALSDAAPTGGILSNDPAISPFANWTKVFLPYCTQDVFIGGGKTSAFGSVTVHRYGAVNTRAALRKVRDILWDELDRTSAEGYHPRRVRAFFGGFSAGAFGTLYNYHWVLDDLPWPRTTAFPDSGLAVDNGEPLGVNALGGLLLNDTPPLGWGARPFTPPYCFRGECAVGPNVLALSSPRLERLPEQQILTVTNQVDQTQVDTTFFSSTVRWVNAMRQSYCNTQGLPGVRYFMPADARSIHVIADVTDLFVDRVVDGETMQEWFAGAIADPAAVVDRVEEGSLVDARPGVEPFACDVAP